MLVIKIVFEKSAIPTAQGMLDGASFRVTVAASEEKEAPAQDLCYTMTPNCLAFAQRLAEIARIANDSKTQNLTVSNLAHKDGGGSMVICFGDAEKEVQERNNE